MSRRITAPETFETGVKNLWPGSVEIADPLTMEHVEIIETALEMHGTIQESKSVVYFTVLDKPKLDAIRACVEKWDLKGFSSDAFPMSPRKASHELIDWLFTEIMKIYVGAEAIPNG